MWPLLASLKYTCLSSPKVLTPAGEAATEMARAMKRDTLGSRDSMGEGEMST